MHAPKPPQRDNKDVSLKDGLPGYQAKLNILKQIDDAASQMGGSQSKARSTRSNFDQIRQSESKRTAAMILSKGNKGTSGLKNSDLDSLNGYNHNKTLLGTNGFKPESLIYNQTDYKQDGPRRDEDLRSLKSEYDYAHKKKFVDVLGNIKKSKGLSGLQMAEKNLQDNASHRSGMSKRSYASSKFSRVGGHKAIDYTTGFVDAIKEEDESPLTVIDKNGQSITLNPEQMAYLVSLNLVAENQDGEPPAEVDYGMIENMNPYDLQHLKNLGEQEEESAGLFQVPISTNKRLYPFHYHQNSEDYKNLGNMHRENRTIEYYPQDQKPQFQTKPVIVSNKEKTYDFEKDTGLAASHRLAASNNAGQGTSGRYKQANVAELASIRRPNDEMNRYTKVDPMSESYQTVTGGFPKTTNQDFHNVEPFIKAASLKGGMQKQNNKKATVYNAYVNAMFNSGVFCNPGQDQC